MATHKFIPSKLVEVFNILIHLPFLTIIERRGRVMRLLNESKPSKTRAKPTKFTILGAMIEYDVVLAAHLKAKKEAEIEDG